GSSSATDPRDGRVRARAPRPSYCAGGRPRTVREDTFLTRSAIRDRSRQPYSRIVSDTRLGSNGIPNSDRSGAPTYHDGREPRIRLRFRGAERVPQQLDLDARPGKRPRPLQRSFLGGAFVA